MPLFDFVNEKGERRELIVPGGTYFTQFEGDNWSRVSEPPRICVKGDSISEKEQMRRDLHKLECRPKGWRSKKGFSKNKVKKVWGL